MNKEILKNIANIILGYSFRSAIKHNKEGGIFVVGARDVKESFYTLINDLPKIRQEFGESKILKKGDVLLSNRMYFKASVFDGNERVIPASSVYILRPKTDIVLPEFLAIWLNSPKGQNEILKNATGAAVKTILKKDLEDLKIEIPELEKQKIIVELFKNKIELKNKLERKKEIMENIFQRVLTTIN